MKKTKVLKSWSRRNLPEQLWPDILSRLPVKSLLRFRCVSNPWKILIDDPDFARLHLKTLNKYHEPHIFFLQGTSYECVVKNNKTLRTNFSLGFLQSNIEPAHSGPIKSWSIFSSIDGLFTLQSKEGLDLMLWNPSIRKTLILPPSPEIPTFNTQNVDFGLGFDPSINDYKVVRFVLIPTKGVYFVAIYSLKTNSWKGVEFQGERRHNIRFCHGHKSISFNGVLYGIAKNEFSSRMKLVSYDLRSEVFASTELPRVDDSIKYSCTYHRALTLIDDGCSLALVNLCKPRGSIWTLESSCGWIMRYNFATTVPDYSLFSAKMKFLCMKKNGEMLLQWRNMVISYNLETQQEKMMLEKNKKMFHEGNTLPYIESLILHN